MSRSVSDRKAACFGALAILALALPEAARAQSEADAARRIISSEISVSRREAMLKLELVGGQHIELGVRDGKAYAAGRALGDAPRGGPLDTSWRRLLDQVIEAPTPQLAVALIRWDPPADALARTMDSTLEAALTRGELLPLDPASAAVQAANTEAEDPILAEQTNSDSVDRLVDRIFELEQLVERLEDNPDADIERDPPDRGFSWTTPFRNIAHGLAGILSILVTYAVLFGIGLATIFFGGRRFIEGVADTARHATVRSLLVGLAATFLVVPAFILGIIALAISIVGIPALVVWIPVFPVATALAVLMGYIAVAHAAGESLAERRFYASDWVKRGNSYYFIMTGLGLLLALFIAAQIVSMAGQWLGFFRGILTALGVVVTWAALSVGFGAVLLSRGGSRPVRANQSLDPEIYAETTSA